MFSHCLFQSQCQILQIIKEFISLKISFIPHWSLFILIFKWTQTFRLELNLILKWIHFFLLLCTALYIRYLFTWKCLLIFASIKLILWLTVFLILWLYQHRLLHLSFIFYPFSACVPYLAVLFAKSIPFTITSLRPNEFIFNLTHKHVKLILFLFQINFKIFLSPQRHILNSFLTALLNLLLFFNLFYLLLRCNFKLSMRNLHWIWQSG